MRFLRPLAALLALTVLAAAKDQSELQASLQNLLTTAEKMIADDASSLRGYSMAGDAAQFLGQAAKAVQHYRKMIELDPSQDAPHWRLGIAYFFNHQFAESSAQFAKYHAYDARDRENGVWKFLGDARLGGLEKARKEMLPYTEFDREPFPAIYDLYAGKITPEQFTAGLEERKLTNKPGVMFFAHYYGGLYQEMLGNREAALAGIRRAVALFEPDEGYASGPGYMWQTARVHADWLAAEPKK